MKTIQINFTRVITFNKIVKVSDAVAKKALALDGSDLSNPNVYPNNNGWSLITEELVDAHDVLDAADEIENLSVRIYKAKNKK